MNNLISALGLVFILTCPSLGQQVTILKGKKCNCINNYKEQYPQNKEILGFASFPKPLLPDDEDLKSYLDKKVGKQKIKKAAADTTVINLFINKRGKIKCIYLVKGTLKKHLRAQLVKFILEVTFNPAYIRGKPINSFYSFPLRF